MNLKKIAGMCKTAGSFYVTNIVNDDGEVTDQWVILGPAAYRVGNMGLTANMLARFAGIKDTQLSSYVLKDAGLSQKHTEPGSVSGNDRPHSRWA